MYISGAGATVWQCICPTTQSDKFKRSMSQFFNIENRVVLVSQIGFLWERFAAALERGVAQR